MPARPVAFEAKVDAEPETELAQFGALARAIAEAAQEAAQTISKPEYFEISRIQIKVEPNPGPTAYRVTIVPAG